MRRPCVALLAAAAVLAAIAPDRAAARAVVHGIELDSRRGHDRLLILADAAFDFELLEPDAETLIVRLADAVLDPEAPRLLAPPLGGSLRGIAADQETRAGATEVRVTIGRRPGLAPRISQRSGLLALDFAAPRPDPKGVDLRMRSTQIAALVRRVAAATGESFLFDERLSGLVTVMVPERVSHQEALEILHVALLSRGFVAVPTPGGVRKILSVDEAAANAPLVPPPVGLGGDAPITTMVRLETADAQSVAESLVEYAGNSSQLLPYPPTNSLILAGSELRLQRLLTLIRALDAAAESEVILRRVRHRDAQVLLEILQETYADDPLGAGRFSFQADARTNTLLIGAPVERAAELRGHIALLDRPPEGRGRVELVRVRYLEAERLAELLLGLVQGSAEAATVAAGPLAGRQFGLAVDTPSRSLLMTGDPETLALLRDVIDELDREPRRVLVELMILEITLDDRLELALDGIFNFAVGGVIGSVSSDPSGGGFAQPGATSIAGAARFQGPLLVLPVLDPNGNPIMVREGTGVVTAEQRLASSRLLQRPHLLVASGEEQQIFVGDNLPIPVQSAEQGDVLQTQLNIQRQDVGITVRVKPTVGAAGGIELQLFAEQAALGPSLAGPVERVGPSVQSRTLETTLRLRDGAWAVAGMGYEPVTQEQHAGTPFLKDIPVLGALLSSRRDEQLRRQLVIAVRAEIVSNRAELTAESIRRRVGLERSLSRTRGLEPERDGPVALLLSSRDSEESGRALAEAFAGGPGEPRLVSWEWEGRVGYDVYLTGFPSVVEAAEAAAELAAEGWSPGIVPVPGATPEPGALHERAGASVPPTSPF